MKKKGFFTPVTQVRKIKDFWVFHLCFLPRDCRRIPSGINPAPSYLSFDIEPGGGHSPVGGNLYSNNPGAFHYQFYIGLIFIALRFGFGQVIHGSHARHGRHIVIDQDQGLGHLPATHFSDADFNPVVAQDGRVTVHDDFHLIDPGLGEKRQTPGLDAGKGQQQDEKQKENFFHGLSTLPQADKNQPGYNLSIRFWKFPVYI